MTNNQSDPPPAPAPSSPAPAPSEAAPPQPPPAAADPWTERLKQNMVRDRKRLRRNVTITAVLLGLAVAAGLWWLAPGPSLPPLLAVAFDDVCLPAAKAVVRLQLEPAAAGVPFPRNLAGVNVVFAEADRPNVPLAKLVTDRTGRAQTSVQFAEHAAEVRFTGRFEAKRQDRIEQGKIYFLPPENELVLVDVQDLFANAGQELTAANLNKIALHEPTADKLKSLAAQKRQIVYLAVGSDTAAGYQLARRWIAGRSRALPPGPVLGRPSYHDARTAADAREEIKNDLGGRWKTTAFTKG